MAKLHKVEMYVLDVHDDYESLEQITSDINNRMDVDLIPFNVQSVNFDWHDDHVLNFTNAKESDYRGMFPCKE